jgi:hypothetical protein
MSGHQSSSAADRYTADAPRRPVRLKLGRADAAARAIGRSLRRARAVLGPLIWSLVVLFWRVCVMRGRDAWV